MHKMLLKLWHFFGGWFMSFHNHFKHCVLLILWFSFMPSWHSEDESSSSSSNSGIFNNNGYEVTEDVDEDRKGWGGWFDFSNFFGGSSSGSRAQNKIAPRPDRRNGRYSEQDAPLENKVAPKNDRRNNRRDYERPLENKIAPNYDRRNYQRRYSDQTQQDRAAPRREGRDRFVFEHRSLWD